MAAKYLDRSAIVRAAADVADRDGWLHLTMSSVADAVDRHVTSLYGHVDGIDGLRVAVQMLALEELGDRCWEAALGRSGADALEALTAVYRTYVRDHPGRSASLSDADVSDPEIRRLGARIAEPFFVTLRGFGVPDADLRSTQALISLSVRGFGQGEAQGRFGRRPAADRAFHSLQRLFVDALSHGTWPTAR